MHDIHTSSRQIAKLLYGARTLSRIAEIMLDVLCQSSTGYSCNKLVLFTLILFCLFIEIPAASCPVFFVLMLYITVNNFSVMSGHFPVFLT